MNYKILPKFYKAFSWCEKNDVRIYPQIRGKQFQLVFVIDGVARSTGKLHDKEDLQERIKEFYIYIYEKLNNVTD